MTVPGHQLPTGLTVFGDLVLLVLGLPAWLVCSFLLMPFAVTWTGGPIALLIAIALWILASVGVTMASVWLLHKERAATVTPRALTMLGGLVFHGFDKPQVVQVHGSVGHPVKVTVAGANRVRLFEALPGSGRTVQDILDEAQRAAEVIGVPVDVHTDVEAWKRWERDADLRRHYELKHKVDASRHHYPEFHEVPAKEPPDLQVDHQGMRIQRLRIDADGLRSGDGCIPWSIVREAELCFSNDLNGRPTQGSVWVRYDGGIWEVANLPARQAAHLAWLRDRFREHAGRALRDQGSAADVPAALRELPREL